MATLGQVGQSQLEGMIESLVDAACDREEEVRKAIAKSLVDIGRKKYVCVLKICHTYLMKHNRLPRSHRTILLQLMEKIAKEHIHDLSEELAKELIALGSAELTLTDEILPDWQTAASALLSTLGIQHAKLVLQELLTKFKPGCSPHFFVVQTLGQLAVSNAAEVVPFLNTVLGRMLPMMGAAKYENMQWVFSNAIARFCEAILEFLADEHRAAEAKIRAADFEGQIYSAYEQLFNVWLQSKEASKEARLRLAVAEAIGFSVHLCAADALDQQLPKLISGVVQLYRKHPDHYYVSQCLYNVVDAARKKNCANLGLHLDNLLVILHQHACIPLDMSSSVSVKNHNELLRCFAVLTLAYSDRVITFLLSKLELNQEKFRVPTLNIMKHIINSCDEELENKKSLIVSGLSNLLTEATLKLPVRSIFGQVIIAMAHHDYLSLEGGHQMIEFMVKQCAIYTEDKALAKLSGNGVTPVSLRDMSNSVLLLITTTIKHMEDVLWPYLIEFITPVEYTLAAGIVCQCVAAIGSKKREEEAEDYELNFDVQVNLPKPPELMARLFVLAGHPHNGQERGEHVLACMRALVPNLHEDLVDLWDAAIPKLLTSLTGQNKKKTWNQNLWEDRMLKLLSLSLDQVDNEEWLMELGNALGDREQVITKYSHYPQEKGFLYKCLGVILRKTTQRQFVQKHLDTMFATVRHTSQVEREGCAIGTGFCAASHLDSVLHKLEQVTKEDMVRKPKGFFGLTKDKSEADIERMKATVMLCYGFVTFHSPPDLITSRVEVNILRSINPHFEKIRDTTVKQNLIRTIDLIGRALHPDHLKSHDFVFKRRGDLITHLLGYIKVEPTNVPVATETRALAISALATLCKLEPKLTAADQFEVIQVSTDSVFPLPLMVSPMIGKKKEIMVSVEESRALMAQALKEVYTLLMTLLAKEFSSENLENIFKHLEPWIQSSDELERTRAMTCVLDLLKMYLAHSEENEPSRHLPLQGQLLGRLVPRCSDPILSIRQAAIECVQIVLKIATCMPGITDQLVDAISLLKERAEKEEPNTLFSLVNDLSKVLCKKISSENLWPLVYYLLDGLVDYQGQSSNGACVVLNNIVKLRGSTLSDQIPDLIDGLHDKLQGITNPQTRTGTLRCMRTICYQYLSPTLTHLLNKPLPWDYNLVAMWHVLTGEPKLVRDVFAHLLEVLTLSLPYQEKTRGSKTLRVETDVPKAATNAIGVLCQVEEVGLVAKELFSRIFSTLLLRVGVSSSIETPDPKSRKPSCISVAISALQQFLKCSESEEMEERLEQYNAWVLMEKEDTCPHGLLHIARALKEYHPDEVQKVVDSISSSLTSIYDAHRVTVVAFYSELVCTLTKDELALAEQIMNNLLGRQVDSNYIVRMYCIRGLGNMADIGGSQVSKFSTTILSAMLAGMDDREDPEDLITMEAMSGLARIFEQIDEGHVRPILINIALRIRPCFEKPTPAVRAAAFTLFGSLSRFGNGPSEGPFLEQIQTNFVTLLLHLDEADPVVIAACKAALQRLGPLMSSRRVNEMFQKHLKPEDSLLYADFLNDLCKLIVQDFTDKVNFYVMNSVTFFKSMWPEVRRNASLFVGYMLGNLPLEKSGIVSKEHICEALTLLLKDPSPQVRASTAEAMSLLDQY